MKLKNIMNKLKIKVLSNRKPCVPIKATLARIKSFCKLKKV